MIRLVTRIVLAAAALGLAPLAGAGTCEGLAALKLPHTKILSVQSVAAGAFQPPPGPAGPTGFAPPRYDDLPAFCRVQASARPSSDSDIRIEIWLPLPSAWNGKLRGTGNGGLGGGTGASPRALSEAMRGGYVSVGTNTGHAGDSSYAIDHPEQIKDFGYRSAHEMTLTAKALMRAYYGRGPRLSYMAEEGGGTIAALSEAQRYPADYNAIAATGMASYLTHHVFGQMWIWQATHATPESFIPPAKYAVLHAAALAACDAADGLKDGIIGDPEHCHFDPVVTLCKGADAPDCLTAAQVEAARKLYRGPYNPRTHVSIYSPLYPGSELGWGMLAGPAKPFQISLDFFKDYVFRNPNWDYRTRPVNYDSDVALADAPVNLPTDAVDPDLNAFFARGGKLLLIGGWNDTGVPPRVAVDYYKAVVAKVGARKVRQSMRFFMVPGMGHGLGKNGAENFDADPMDLIVQWQEHGVVPDQLIVTHYRNGVEVGKRLVCQYPLIAYYNGGGNTEDPASYRCRTSGAN
jgi:Tannase and feruloyl esterase